MYAVIKTGGKQYRVAADDVIEIERTGAAEGDIVEFPVLMVGADDKVEVGTPIIDGASVAGQVMALSRGPKIIIFKKKRRKHYRRKNGHRQDLMQVQITEILTDGKKPSKKAAAPKAAAAPKKEAAPKVEKTEAKAEAPAKTGDALFAAPAGEPDDLKKISGVGPVLEKKLNDLGVTKFAQVAAFSPEDVTKLDDALSFKGRIDRDEWISQAAKLAADEA